MGAAPSSNAEIVTETAHISPSRQEGPTGGTREKFHAFLEAANRPGALDARTKRAMAIALSVLARCGACVKHHIHKAKEEGFSPEEIDEAAWMAIAFGGSPTMMFYNETTSTGDRA
jgi:AhpD family alkylhydroperoxidase